MDHNDASMIAANGRLSSDCADALFHSMNTFSLRYKTTIIDILITAKYDKNTLAAYIIQLIKDTLSTYPDADKDELIWFLCNDLLTLRVMKYLQEYIDLLNNEEIGSARQLMVDLVAKSKKDVNDILLAHIDEYKLTGHVLAALYRRGYSDVAVLAQKYTNDERGYLRRTANKIIKKTTPSCDDR